MLRPRVVLVGVGAFGKNHLRVLRELEQSGLCELYAVVDKSKKALEVARSLIGSSGVKFTPDLEPLLRNADAVDIVTPASTHYELCKACLEEGCHVFVEKPMATSYRQALDLVRTATKQSLVLAVGHIFRYNMAVRFVKDYVGRGQLGDVYYLTGKFINLKAPRNDVGAILNYAVHHVDIFSFVLEALPTHVFCYKGHYLNRSMLEDAGFIMLKYPKGIIATLEVSWVHPIKRRTLTVVGGRQSLFVDLLEQKVRIFDARLELEGEGFKPRIYGERVLNIKHEEPLKLELTDFLESIVYGREPLASGRQVLFVIRVLELAIKSAREGREVRIHYDRF